MMGVCEKQLKFIRCCDKGFNKKYIFNIYTAFDFDFYKWETIALNCPIHSNLPH